MSYVHTSPCMYVWMYVCAKKSMSFACVQAHWYGMVLMVLLGTWNTSGYLYIIPYPRKCPKSGVFRAIFKCPWKCPLIFFRMCPKPFGHFSTLLPRRTSSLRVPSSMWKCPNSELVNVSELSGGEQKVASRKCQFWCESVRIRKRVRTVRRRAESVLSKNT